MTALSWRGATVRRGGRAVLDGVDLDVPAGAFVAVVGPNGAGKSTLLRAALGLVPLDAGEVRLGEAPVDGLPPRERAARVGWLPQRQRLADAVPAVELVASARFRFDETRTAARAAARRCLERAGVGVLADRPVDALSGGEAQRVALAALLAQEAGAWLLDEPANHLDPAVRLAVHGLLGEAWREGRTVVVVTHDLHLLPHLVDAELAGEVRVIGLGAGRVVVDRRLDDPELPDALGALYGVRLASVEAHGRRHFVVGPP